MSKPVNSALVGAIASVAASAVTRAAQRADVPINAAEASSSVVQSAVRGAAESIVRASPELQHLTSSEPWYASRANWAAIISALTPVLVWGAGLFGRETAIDQDTAMVCAVIFATVGGWWASYLARRARTATKPLGS